MSFWSLALQAKMFLSIHKNLSRKIKLDFLISLVKHFSPTQSTPQQQARTTGRTESGSSSVQLSSRSLLATAHHRWVGSFLILVEKGENRINNEREAIKLYFTFENCIIKYLFVFYRTRNSFEFNFTLSSSRCGKKLPPTRRIQMWTRVCEMNIKSLSCDEFISCSWFHNLET